MRIVEKFNIQTNNNTNSSYKILAVDDEIGIIESLSIFLNRSNYSFTGETNPLKAIERLKTQHYDVLILDFVMSPLNGEQVVQEVRKFNKDIYIILLTGHKDLVPPLETIRQLDIQGYCEKSNKFDQLLLLVESGIKTVSQMQEIKRINNELSDTNGRLKRAYMDSIQTVRYAVEAKDPYTRGHSDRVAEYSVLIGEYLGLTFSELNLLRIGGLFHDVGKIGVRDSILQKNGKLTDFEYGEIKKHPIIGAHILSNASFFQDIIPIVKYHHERYDGKGYPDGLSGNNIPYLARITAVADSFDAMTSRRIYRSSLSLSLVISEIENNKGSQFDPYIADCFLNILRNHYEKILSIQKKFV